MDGCFAAFAGVLRDFVTASYPFSNEDRTVGSSSGRRLRAEEAAMLHANAPREEVADLLVSPVPTTSLHEGSARRDRCPATRAV
jgi:hypothetical protein